MPRVSGGDSGKKVFVSDNPDLSALDENGPFTTPPAADFAPQRSFRIQSSIVDAKESCELSHPDSGELNREEVLNVHNDNS